MTDSALQRLNMVESQIRPSDVTDRRILRAMSEVPRERFVPTAMATLAYMDTAVPLEASGDASAMARSLMSPRIFAKLVQLAAIENSDRVLIVGVGGGYSAAIIARMAASVVALEADEIWTARAAKALADTSNITFAHGSLPLGAPQHGPYDVIFVEGLVWAPPSTLLNQLAPDGRLVATSNEGSVQRATVWRRIGDKWGATTSFEAEAGALPGFEPKREFVF
jgi:protein-L-isoaspartate(D-aspartate) O-methyltransferase